jgi:hypothetical protein
MSPARLQAVPPPFGTWAYFPLLDLTPKDIPFAGGADTVERSSILNADSAGHLIEKDVELLRENTRNISYVPRSAAAFGIATLIRLRSFLCIPSTFSKL